jgi:glycopeptide antibiotics resistance protein
VLDLAPGIAAGYLPISLLILLLVGAGLMAIRSRRISMAEAARATILDLGIGTWLALTLLVTVVPMGARGPAQIGLIPFLDSIDRIAKGLTIPSDEAADIILNVVLFMPFGAWVALRLGRPRMVAAIVGGAVLSIGIELSQAFEAAGRDASATDIVTNTTGAALGFLVGLRIRGPARSPAVSPADERP